VTKRIGNREKKQRSDKETERKKEREKEKAMLMSVEGKERHKFFVIRITGLSICVLH